jgi:hypothetical protein
VAKTTKNKKSKEGRHVGLDFYDLLIEALKTPPVRVNECIAQKSLFVFPAKA